MDGSEFLTEYMHDYSEDYILIGGNACAVNFKTMGADFRATVDLDIVLITESTNEQFYGQLWDFIIENGYEGKSFRGSNAGGSAYRFTQPMDDRKSGVPVQIELFSRKPDYFDAAYSQKGRAHITPIKTGEKISNFSAILLDDAVYDFIRSSKVTIERISTVTLECLFGLKSVAWHSNQRLYDEKLINDYGTVIKHPLDMISIANVLEDPQEILYPQQIFDSLIQSRSELSNPDVRASLGVDEASIDLTVEYINTFAKNQSA